MIQIQVCHGILSLQKGPWSSHLAFYRHGLPRTPHHHVMHIHSGAFLACTPGGKQRIKSDRGGAKDFWGARESVICPIFKGLGIIIFPNPSTKDIITIKANK